jgi:hypothetical protein
MQGRFKSDINCCVTKDYYVQSKIMQAFKFLFCSPNKLLNQEVGPKGGLSRYKPPYTFPYVWAYLSDIT